MKKKKKNQNPIPWQWNHKWIWELLQPYPQNDEKGICRTRKQPHPEREERPSWWISTIAHESTIPHIYIYKHMHIEREIQKYQFFSWLKIIYKYEMKENLPVDDLNNAVTLKMVWIFEFSLMVSCGPLVS